MAAPELAEPARRHPASDFADDDGERHDGQLLMAVTNRIVAIYKECYGKGPTKARTYMQENVALCLLSGGFTRVEQTLHDSGRGAAVLEQRARFQDAVEDRFRSAIEELTGRRVTAFMSGADQDADVICEVFLLEPM